MRTEIPSSFFSRIGAAARYAVSGTALESWFGPQKPLAPQAPPEVKGRQWDYPFGANLNYTPRSEAAISFHELRALADALPLLRLVIETRKDQIAGLRYTVRSRDPRGNAAAAPRIASTLAFLAKPDRRHSFATWLRLWLEDMLVIDAATLYPRLTLGGDLYSIDVIDGSTITPLIAEDGRTPEPPDPAYQQVLHGVPAADFTSDELLYLPRNPRPHRLYGMSPVEQVALTVNIALRRDMATLDYYRLGSTPDAFATLPKDWTLDQIRQFQDYFDALMSGNLARRRMVKFMPNGFELRETRQPPLKDQYDEWLARVICYAFSIPPSPFVTQVNRATSETLRMQAAQEGLVPLKAWVKGVLDEIVQVCLKQPDLEFAWVGDDAVDPMQQAQTLSLLVGAGIKTREEARAELGLAPDAPPTRSPLGVAASRLGKSNPNHDERGRFTTPDGAVAPGAATPPTPQSPATPEGGKAPENPSGGSNPGAGGDANARPTASDSTARQQDPKPGTGPAEALGAPWASRVYEAAVRSANDAIAAAEREVGSAASEAMGSIVGRAVWGAMMSVASATAILLATTQPAGRGMVQGSVSGRPDITYDWNQEGLVAYHVLIDGQWRTLGAFQDATGNVRDANGNVLATVSHGPGSTLSLTSDAAAIDRAAAALPTDTSDASSGLDQIYVDPSTGLTLVVPAGTDPVTLPPGFVPMGSDSGADNLAPESAGGGNSVNSSPPAGGASDGSSGGNSGLVDPELINQLIAGGVKITPGNVVATGVMRNGSIVWLETGDAIKGGLLHILGEHATDFANVGISEAQIPKVLMDAVTQGNIVGYQGRGTDGPVFEITIGGLIYDFTILIGGNGFIVGANPTGSGR